MGDSINPFAVLGIDETATTVEAQAAYRAQARTLHPDRFAGAPEDERASAEAAMAELNIAYELLTDDGAREQYRRTQQRRRAAAAARGEQLPTHPSREPATHPAPPEDPEEPASAEAPRVVEDYRQAATAEFSVANRTAGTPWVATPRRSRRFRLGR